MADWGGGMLGTDDTGPFKPNAPRDVMRQAQNQTIMRREQADADRAAREAVLQQQQQDAMKMANNNGANNGGMNPFAGMGQFGGQGYDPYAAAMSSSYQPFADMGMNTVAQGFGAMQNLPNALASQFGWTNALNSANQQAYNQAAAPVQIAQHHDQTELAKAGMFAPLLQALIGGIGNIAKTGMSGFKDTATSQMAQLPSGSSAQPVNFR